MTIIRFPTEKCRLPGESRAHYEWRTTYQKQFAPQPWDPPLLDELAKGVQDSYPYP